MQDVQEEHGTTVVVLNTNGGEDAVYASDSRRTRKRNIDGVGVRHIVSNRINKIRRLGLNNNVFMAGSGKAFGVEAMSASMPTCEDPSRAANIISEQISGFQNRFMVAGFNPNGGASVFRIRRNGNIRENSTWYAIGSGADKAASVIDNEYTPDMGVEEAAELARRAICEAASVDESTGGFFRVRYVGAVERNLNLDGRISILCNHIYGLDLPFVLHI